jgi:3-phenylpropionate/cinnamic acid dioxygenase small subunit
MATKKKVPAKKALVKKAAAKPVAKKAAVKKSAVKKPAARKAAGKPVAKPAAKKPAAKKVTAKKVTAKKIAVKKPAAKKASAKKPVTRKAVVAPAFGAGATQRAVEQFLYKQSGILDTRQWQSFIDLFTPDGVYWVPITPDQTEWEGSPSIFAEDKLMMEVRMRRVMHPQAWSQAPMWATNHLVSNVVIESETPTEVKVRSRFHMMELRRDTVRHFGGIYWHTLVKTAGGYKIKLQRVDMFNSQAPYEYVLQIWV